MCYNKTNYQIEIWRDKDAKGLFLDYGQNRLF